MGNTIRLTKSLGPKKPPLGSRVSQKLTAAGLVLGMLVSLGQTSDARADAETDFKQSIRAKYDMKEAAFAANDPEPILTRFYHPDVISTGPDGSTHSGREGLRTIYEEVIGGEVRIESVDTYFGGEAGWDWVNFHVTPPAGSGEAPFTFKMLFLWAKEDGEWWSHGEMYVVGEFSKESSSEHGESGHD